MKCERKANVVVQELGFDSIEELEEWNIQDVFHCPEFEKLVSTRRQLAECLQRLHSRKAVQAALGLLEDFISVNLEDHYLLRYQMATLMLSLDRNLDCYNFIIRWNQIEFMKSIWSGSMESLHMGAATIREEKCIGPLPFFFSFPFHIVSSDRRSPYMSLEFIACLALIKYRCISSIISRMLLSEHFSVEMPCDPLVQEIISSYIFWTDIPVEACEDDSTLLRDLFKQFVFLVSPLTSNHANVFWKALLHPTLNLQRSTDDSLASQSKGKSLHLLAVSVMPLWYGSVGAVDFLRCVHQQVLEIEPSVDRKLLHNRLSFPP